MRRPPWKDELTLHVWPKPIIFFFHGCIQIGIIIIPHLKTVNMKNDRKRKENTGRRENPLPAEISNTEKQYAVRAHDEAERDMNDDAELTASSPNDDLDEGETARLGEEKTDII